MLAEREETVKSMSALQEKHVPGLAYPGPLPRVKKTRHNAGLSHLRLTEPDRLGLPLDARVLFR